MEVVADGVVDEGPALLLRRAARLVAEDDVVVPALSRGAGTTTSSSATRRAARRRKRAGPSSTTRSATTSTSASSRSTSSSGRVAGARGDAQGTSNSIDTISHGTPTWSTVTAPGRQPEENERSESGRKVGGSSTIRFRLVSFKLGYPD